ncbi:MAG TPA: hypothetical protein VIJ47_01345 [Acidimicrobiales bacterium]
MKRSVLVVVVAVLALAGCSSGGSSSGSASKSGSADASSTSSTAAAKDNSGSAAGSSIPASDAITTLLSGSDPKRIDLIAKCNEVAVVVLGKSVGLNNDPNVKESLNRLVVVVRPIDPAVADALAADAQSAADWCKATGMAN